MLPLQNPMHILPKKKMSLKPSYHLSHLIPSTSLFKRFLVWRRSQVNGKASNSSSNAFKPRRSLAWHRNQWWNPQKMAACILLACGFGKEFFWNWTFLDTWPDESYILVRWPIVLVSRKGETGNLWTFPLKWHFCRIFRSCEPLFMQQNVGLPHVIGFKGTWNMLPKIVMFHGIRLKLVEKQPSPVQHMKKKVELQYELWSFMTPTLYSCIFDDCISPLPRATTKAMKVTPDLQTLFQQVYLQYVWYMFIMFADLALIRFS